MIGVSIVTYKTSQDELRTVLLSVLNSKVDQVYIIDNSPSDLLRSFERQSPKIRYIHNINTGYGSGHNIAIRESMASGMKYHVVMNPDIWFEPGVIEQLEEYMEQHADVGQVMPRVTYPNGHLQYLCKLLPTPMDLLVRRFLPRKMMAKRSDRFELRAMGYDRPMNVPFLSGCFMFLRIEALRKVGLFDERFFMYGEDIDLSRRIHAHYRTMYQPAVSIVHAHKAESYRNKRMLLIHMRNIMRYFNKWGWIFDGERRLVNRRTLEEVDRLS